MFTKLSTIKRLFNLKMSLVYSVYQFELSLNRRIVVLSAVREFRDLLKQEKSANDEAGFLQQRTLLISDINKVRIFSLQRT